MTGTCPAPPVSGSSPGWAKAEIVASNITNKNNAADRPLFFNNMAGTDTSTITQMRADIYGLFSTAVNNPKETRISTGVYLRNQNQVPTAAIQTQRSSVNTRSYQLNGTTSSDPEGRTLEFTWYKGTPGGSATATAAKLPSCASSAPADQTKSTSGETWTCIGFGAVLNYTFPSSDTSNTMAVALKVADPGGLIGLATVNSLALN
jgi:hypothetical protein